MRSPLLPRSPALAGLAALALVVAACGTPRMNRHVGADAATLMPADAVTEDDEILHVFITANRGEVMTSQPFVEQFESNEVRDFAMTMVREHTAVLERAEALPIEPDDNRTSVRLQTMAETKARELGDFGGADLDRAYMDAQIQMHTQTLDMLDRVLIPNATDPALRALLQSARPAVAAHLQEAQRIHHSLM